MSTMYNETVQSLAEERVEAYEIYRIARLKDILRNSEHAALRNATACWIRMCRERTEYDLKVQLSLALKTFLPVKVHFVLLHVFEKWKQYVSYLSFKHRNAQLNGQLRQLETLCAQLSTEGA